MSYDLDVHSVSVHEFLFLRTRMLRTLSQRDQSFSVKLVDCVLFNPDEAVYWQLIVVLLHPAEL